MARGDKIIERGLPNDEVVERTILGQLVLENSLISEAEQLLTDQDFHLASHRLIWQTIVEMNKQGRSIDLVTLSAEINLKGQLQQIGGHTEIARLIDGIPRSDTIEPYARTLKRFTMWRNIIAISYGIIDKSYDGDVEAEEVAKDFERGLDEVASLSGRGSLSLFPFRSPLPWKEPVNGAELLDEIASFVSRFISGPDFISGIIALWILHAYTFDAFTISPLLAITSPEKRCGKTTLLMLLHALAPRPLTLSNITASALFRTVEKYKPTLLIDEADTFLTGDEALRGILNSGHRRETAYVVRTVGDKYEPSYFRTWSPKAIALIGNLPDTLEDRSIVIRMQRMRVDEHKEEFRSDRYSELLGAFRSRAARWANDNFSILQSSDPCLPKEITNARARDNWHVLIVIADAVGGDWPRRAREAARGFSGRKPESESIPALLLSDIRAIFDECGESRITSETLINKLAEFEERPWGEFRNGAQMSKQALAMLLKGFDIEPHKWREGQKTLRGYWKADFNEAFARYLDNDSPQTPHPIESVAYDRLESPQSGQGVANRNGDNPLKTKNVAIVATSEAITL